MAEHPEQLARVLKVLAVGTRVRIVQLLKGRALCVGALSARLDVTQGAVSQHLRILRDAGVVLDDKRGCFVDYRLDEQTLAAWREEIDNLLDPKHGAAQDSPGATPCAAAGRKRPAASRKT
ncbi:MAG TPA: metalloregulator ArsR/SmtB family transcription factor [Phycisphaerae bacterium]|nr:metalloregulator ArsR/SmtB family transcription factor [Phycisphaerae bacterium]